MDKPNEERLSSVQDKETNNRRKRLPELVRADRELRRRDRTWRITAPIQIILLTGLLAMGGVLSVAAPKPTESARENRKLAERPAFTLAALADGSYVRGLEAHYADTFPLRDTLVGMAARVQESYGIRLGQGRIYNVADGSAPAEPAPKPEKAPQKEPAPSAPGVSSAPAARGEEASSAPEPPAEPQQPAGPQPQGEQIGSVFVLDGNALSLFGPGNNSAAQYYARTLNDWKAALGADVAVYNLIVPTHIEFINMPERYKGLSAPQKPNIDYIGSLLDPSIAAVDAYSKLAEHREEYLYFHTDHHWTALGAYYAYTAFCEQAGLAPAPLESMERRTLEPFVGSMYAQVNDSTLLSNPDRVDYWMIPTPHEVLQYRRGNPFYGYPVTLLAEYATGANCYSVFLHGDYPLTKVTTNIKNGRKIAVVKESFGNAFAPFLVNHYEEVYIIDQRYFALNLPAFMRENGIGEILFLNNIFAANTTVRINEVARLRTQVYTPPAPEPEEEASSGGEAAGEEEASAESPAEEETSSKAPGGKKTSTSSKGKKSSASSGAKKPASSKKSSKPSSESR